MTGVAKNTIVKPWQLGEACSAYQDQAFRILQCKRSRPTIWSFCYAKQET